MNNLVDKKRSERFPCPVQWPVVPPEQHWLERWHWLRDESGDPYIADWYFGRGWHWGWSGAPSPEDMQGWAYIEVARPATAI